ncbi:ExbD/TolR family protein [Hydrogenimonas sp.]
MRRRESLTQDMTPLVDVVFLLLIFFLVTTVFKKEELALLLNLPEGKEGEKVIDRREIVVELTQNRLAIGGREVSFEVLDARLAGYRDKEKPVIVRIDENVRYKRIVRLFDLLEKHGLNNLQLLEQPR